MPPASETTCVNCCNCDVLRREAVLMHEIMNETCFMVTYTSKAVVERSDLKKTKKLYVKCSFFFVFFFKSLLLMKN